MIGGPPLGIAPPGGAFAPGGDPPPDATLASVRVEALMASSDPLEAAFNGDFSRTAFAVVLEPHFTGGEA